MSESYRGWAVTVGRDAVQDLVTFRYTGPESETKPTANVVEGTKFWETDTGEQFVFDGASWIPAPPSVILPEPGFPRLPISPTVNSVAQSTQEFGGDASSTLRYLRFALNHVDQVTASEAIVDAGPGTFMLWPDQIAMPVRSSTPITRLDVAAIADATSSSPSTGECIAEGASYSDCRSVMQTFEFDSADDVRLLLLTVTPSWTDTYLRTLLQVDGRAYA